MGFVPKGFLLKKKLTKKNFLKKIKLNAFAQAELLACLSILMCDFNFFTVLVNLIDKIVWA